MTRKEYNKLLKYIKDNELEDRFPKYLLATMNMKLLDLSNTKITDITPIQYLSKLVWINLDKTKVSDISPLSKLTNLRWISIEHTKVSDISPLLSLPHIISIFAVGTKIKKRKSNPKVYV